MDELNNVLEEIKKKEVDMGIRIATLKAEVKNLKSELKDCANELCLKCGSYKTQHLGSCDGCRWLPVRRMVIHDDD